MKNNKLIIQERYDKLSSFYSEYAEQAGWCTKEITQEFISMIQFNSGKILDMGCANGYSSHYFFEKQSFEVTGIDISKKCIDAASRLPFKKLIVHDLDEPLPFNDKTFDLVFSYGVLEFIDNLEFIFMEVKRVLKDNGHFLFSLDEYDENSLIQNNKIHPLSEGNWVIKRYTRKDVELISKRNKFLILSDKKHFAYKTKHFIEPVYYRFYLIRKENE